MGGGAGGRAVTDRMRCPANRGQDWNYRSPMEHLTRFVADEKAGASSAFFDARLQRHPERLAVSVNGTPQFPTTIESQPPAGCGVCPRRFNVPRSIKRPLCPRNGDPAHARGILNYVKSNQLRGSRKVELQRAAAYTRQCGMSMMAMRLRGREGDGQGDHTREISAVISILGICCSSRS